MEKIFQVVVHGVTGEKMIVDLCNTEEQMQKMTVRQLKETIKAQFPETAEYLFELIYINTRCEDFALLSHYGIRHMSVIHLVVKVHGGGHDPGKGDGGMGDKEGKNRSMERLSFF